MRFIISVAALVVSAMALTHWHKEDRYGDITVAQAQESCGDHQTVSCCNKKSGDGNNGGALSGLLDNGLLGECAKLGVAIRKASRESRFIRDFSDAEK